MNFNSIKKIVEVLLFSSDRPLTLKQMKDIINEEKSETGVTADIRNIEKAVNELIEKYSSDEYSFSIVQVAGAYRFATQREFSPWLAKLNKENLKRRLSQQALETLSIIAYRQPITKAEIEAIRGVNVDYIIGSLLEKELITIKGRAEVPGRPMLYGTTDSFLEYLGVNSVEDLPSLKAIEEIIKSGPPEGVTQSDIDFFEEINLMKTQASGASDDVNLEPKDISNIHELQNEDQKADREGDDARNEG
ncbi:MAG: SMC-Scp complex subunit ScpB [Chlorobi bacterium]|nr:SMC-Scp complex subunit ScpB [Chlorobiota bacterium]MCI0716164.1 SMC-Scp complex subunit ScpB [Chlorobiota bacterium]